MRCLMWCIFHLSLFVHSSSISVGRLEVKYIRQSTLRSISCPVLKEILSCLKLVFGFDNEVLNLASNNSPSLFISPHWLATTRALKDPNVRLKLSHAISLRRKILLKGCIFFSLLKTTLDVNIRCDNDNSRIVAPFPPSKLVLHFVLAYNQSDPDHPSRVILEYHPVVPAHHQLKIVVWWIQLPSDWRMFALPSTSL